MAIKIKHIDRTLNSFSTDDIIVNVSEGSYSLNQTQNYLE